MTDNPAPAAKSRRRLGVALVASLAVNLFFAGLILGAPLFRGGPPYGAPGPVAEHMAPSPRVFIEVLGHERGRAVLRDMRRQVPDLRERFREVRTTRLAVAAAISAEPYDEKALLDALQELRDAHLELTSAIEPPMATAMASMTDEERARFANLFADPPRRSPGRNGPYEGKPGPQD